MKSSVSGIKNNKEREEKHPFTADKIIFKA